MDPLAIKDLYYTILVAITLQLSLLLPTLMCLIHHIKEPCHTSILYGYAWVQELLHSHPECICTELGVHKEIFQALIGKLESMGSGDSKCMTLEEQLVIFLYKSVTGLSTCHVGK